MQDVITDSNPTKRQLNFHSSWNWVKLSLWIEMLETYRWALFQLEGRCWKIYFWKDNGKTLNAKNFSPLTTDVCALCWFSFENFRLQASSQSFTVSNLRNTFPGFATGQFHIYALNLYLHKNMNKLRWVDDSKLGFASYSQRLNPRHLPPIILLNWLLKHLVVRLACLFSILRIESRDKKGIHNNMINYNSFNIKSEKLFEHGKKCNTL